MPAPTGRPLPTPTPETLHFWNGTREGELRLQRCDDCAKVYFPPRPFCPGCASRRVRVFRASGRARLHSYVINHRPGPGFDAPHISAYSALLRCVATTVMLVRQRRYVIEVPAVKRSAANSSLSESKRS